VLGYVNESCVGGETALRFVDTARLRTLDTVPLLPNGTIEATRWLDRRHLLAVVERSDCISDKDTVVYAVDAASQRVVSRTPLRGDVVGVARARGALVLLVAPRNRIGTASLVTVDATGNLRRVALRGISVGIRRPRVIGGTSTLPRTDVPGLTVSGDRAVVVPPEGPVAVVDLATLRVTRHAIRAARSLSKEATGPFRTAVTLADGLIAVTGWNFGFSNGRSRWNGAGVELVDSHTWRFRRIAPGAESVVPAGGILLTTVRAATRSRLTR